MLILLWIISKGTTMILPCHCQVIVIYKEQGNREEQSWCLFYLLVFTFQFRYCLISLLYEQ